ncbi:response regulator [Aquisalimonas sp.]|uniref:response regulator transcription factor n=2 Tax=Aquisalimonas TaxID=406099 RepID=UPI0025BCD786|nr:response regulator [Aquisalimonas sp.]
MNSAGTVFIVDDDAAIRDSLSCLIRSAGFRPVAFGSGEEFLKAAKADGPACVLLDLRMPGISGTEVQAMMQAERCLIPVIFLSGDGDLRTAVRAVKEGAMDFLQKPDFEAGELIDLVRDAVAHHERRIATSRQEAAFRQGLDQLSGRELQVARLAAAGKANKVIAADLGISERTVEVHRGRAMRKLGLRSAPELIRLAHLLD